MTDPIQLTGVTGNYRAPATLIQIGFAMGSVGGQAQPRLSVLAAPKLSSGTYDVNKIYWPRSEAEVVAGFGRNTEAHLGWKFWNRIFPKGALGMLPYAETSGGTPVSASTTVSISGTATGSTVWTIGVGDVDVSVSILSGDLAADIAAAMRTALGGAAIPCLITGSSTNVIISYIHPGTCGGTSTYKPVKLTTNTPGAGLTVTLPGDLGATTPGVEGSTTEAANLTAALAANTGTRIYNLVSHLGGDSVALAAIAADRANQALPLAGKRGTAIVGYAGTSSAGSTLAVARNYERLCMANSYPCRETAMGAAIQLSALFAKYEQADPTFNFDNYSDPDLLLTAVADSSKWPDDGDNNTTIVGGETPFGVNSYGRPFLVKAVTTRVRDTTGAYADWRAYERHRVSGADDTGDKVQNAVAQAIAKKKLVNDPLMADGKTIDYNKVANLPRGVTCPAKIRAVVQKVLSDAVEAGQAQMLDEMMASLVVERSGDNRGRLLIQYNYYTCDLADQAAIYMAESTPG